MINYYSFAFDTEPYSVIVTLQHPFIVTLCSVTLCDPGRSLLRNCDYSVQTVSCHELSSSVL